MEISPFKIGIVLCLAAMIWISAEFLQGERISEAIELDESSSQDIKINLIGQDIGYYKIFVDNFAGQMIFVQILDANGNVIEEQSVQTKMSVGYFDFKEGQYSAKVTNVSDSHASLQVEFGSTNSQEMIPAGVMLLVGSVLIIIVSYLKMKNYKIAQPDENIS